ncbi:equilibrative nucleotide transporter 3-like [Brassica napus]|uniref:equilibrative nucleotide transporter 3-like n=1 Tax=Brassica napus TaxID=3708 RepID=UPI002078E649|nr:equilibrative nucleotide transporter 3-like [Brassica napus]
MDILQHASLEAECWRKANENEEVEEDHYDPLAIEEEIVPPWIPRIPTCRIDASWINNDSVSGLGWSLKDQLGSEHFGLRACNRSLSALHAEMDGLLWAVSCMREMRISSIRFETDCSDLVDMTMNPMEWPTSTTEIEMLQRLQEDFEDDYHPSRTLTLVYQPSVLGTISVLVIVGQKIKNQRRVFTGYCLFVIGSILLLTVDIVTKGKGGITPFLLLSIVSAGFGVANALVEGAMIGDLSCICPDLIQPFAAGLGVAGAIASVLRLLTKAVFQNSRDGLRKGALSFLTNSLFIELVCVIIYGVMFPKLPMVQKHRARSGSNPVEPVEEVPPLSNQQLAHQNLDRVISLFLIYALTLSIFPGFLYENTGKHSLHSYPLVLVTCFNLSDALSRYITMVKPLKMQSGKVIVASVLARMLFLPAFYITARYADQGWMITLTSFLGISNGYLTVCVLTQTPKRTYNVSEANALGNILVASMLGGIFAGVCLSWLWLIGSNKSF